MPVPVMIQCSSVVHPRPALQAEQAAYGLATRRSEASIRLVRAIGGGWTDAEIKTAQAN